MIQAIFHIWKMAFYFAQKTILNKPNVDVQMYVKIDKTNDGEGIGCYNKQKHFLNNIMALTPLGKVKNKPLNRLWINGRIRSALCRQAVGNRFATRFLPL